MEAGIDLIGNLGYLLLVSAAVGIVAYIIRQPLVLGFSAATGAFLAGVILAGSRFSGDITTLITPTREIFSTTSVMMKVMSW